jgi:hypothetical protein
MTWTDVLSEAVSLVDLAFATCDACSFTDAAVAAKTWILAVVSAPAPDLSVWIAPCADPVVNFSGLIFARPNFECVLSAVLLSLPADAGRRDFCYNGLISFIRTETKVPVCRDADIRPALVREPDMRDAATHSRRLLRGSDIAGESRTTADRFGRCGCL